MATIKTLNYFEGPAIRDAGRRGCLTRMSNRLFVVVEPQNRAFGNARAMIIVDVPRSFPGADFDMVWTIRRAAEVLAQGGSAPIVEPMAGNTVEENFNPIGRTFAAASTLCCTSNSLALNGPSAGGFGVGRGYSGYRPRGRLQAIFAARLRHPSIGFSRRDTESLEGSGGICLVTEI